MQTINLTLQIFLSKFPGQVLIPLDLASESVGISGKTARNRLANGTFPIPTLKSAGRRFIHINDLALYVESLRNPISATLNSSEIKKGRPLKSSKNKVQRGQ